jgi:hypothetical protein
LSIALVAATAVTLAMVPAAPAGTYHAALTPVTFAAAGDMGYSPDATATLTAVAGSGADFYLHFGDMAYDQLAPEAAWCSFVNSKVGTGFPYEIVSGGHDLGHKEGLIDRYASCLPDRMHSTGTYGKEYYFDHPAAAPLARVIMISPSLPFMEETYDYSAGTQHYQWLTAAIDDARARGIPWVVVGMARDCVTAGEKHCEIGTDLFNLLVERRVDLILQGHEHGYERSKQLASGPNCPAVPLNRYDPACVADDGADGVYTKGAGPVIVIAGTSGIPLRSMRPKDPEAPDFVTLMGSNMNPTKGFVKYTLTAGELTARFVRTAQGSFTDAFTIKAP